MLSMSLQFRQAVENIDVWSVSSADSSFVITFAGPTGPGFHGRRGFLASWRPLYYSIYRDFHQIGDEEVIATLKRLPMNRVVHASDCS